jgi:uncharacterized protein YeaO (DUF488 family)
VSDDVASAPELVWEYEGGRLRRAQPGGQAKKTDGNRTARKEGSGDQRDSVLARGRTTLILGSPTTNERSPSMQQQPRVRVGRVYDQRTAEDGARVLVDRLWPRGLTKNQADLDEWCKQIAPSAGLRSWYAHDPHRFAEFGRRYRTELDDPGRAGALQHLRQLAQRQPLTLLTAARRADISEAAVLAEQLLDAEPGAS